jgi:hypothetical protein
LGIFDPPQRVRTSRLLVRPPGLPKRDTNKREEFIMLVGEATRFSSAQHQKGQAIRLSFTAFS